MRRESHSRRNRRQLCLRFELCEPRRLLTVFQVVGMNVGSPSESEQEFSTVQTQTLPALTIEGNQSTLLGCELQQASWEAFEDVLACTASSAEALGLVVFHQHLEHFLDETRQSEIAHPSGSFPAERVKATQQHRQLHDHAIAVITESLRSPSAGNVITIEDLAKPNFGRPDFEATSVGDFQTVTDFLAEALVATDLYLGVGGVQGVELEGNVTASQAKLTGTLVYTYHDYYGFAEDEACGIELVECRLARELQVNGYAKPFRVTITVTENIDVALEPTSIHDLDGDGLVGFSDFLEFASHYGTNHEPADFDQSGEVDFADFLEFARHFGQPAAR